MNGGEPGPRPTGGSTPSASTETATLAGGCFWCTEAVFSQLRGVSSVEPGYTGGTVASPTYEQVCTGRTGHAEAIQVVFDPMALSFHDLLLVFFSTHDPTTLNRQGHDVGTQYRSAVFYHSPLQRDTAHEVVREIVADRLWRGAIVTEITPAQVFYPAEEYHRNYFARNPTKAYCQMVIEPKVAKFRKQFVGRLTG
ncbi:MAG TPA: peptide-methionine (S)-S-oxide reductase MsrA [Thermoplasmata archaeon]|nr:peptide-methionine (S)-S-oxide reductase MsrA [Thermoplasmata archaeon]